jgi:hypothetical protein
MVMNARLVQSKNEKLPRIAAPETVTATSLWQFWKAEFPMLVTPLGITISVISEYQNA